MVALILQLPQLSIEIEPRRHQAHEGNHEEAGAETIMTIPANGPVSRFLLRESFVCLVPSWLNFLPKLRWAVEGPRDDTRMGERSVTDHLARARDG